MEVCRDGVPQAFQSPLKLPLRIQETFQPDGTLKSGPVKIKFQPQLAVLILHIYWTSEILTNGLESLPHPTERTTHPEKDVSKGQTTSYGKTSQKQRKILR